MSHGAPLLISRGWRLAPPPGFSKLSQTLGLKGLKAHEIQMTHHEDLVIFLDDVLKKAIILFVRLPFKS